MREALAVASELGISIEAHGSGVVQEQWPSASEPLAEGRTVKLFFGLAAMGRPESEDSSGERGG